MKSVILVMPAPKRPDMYANRLPPLGILYIASFLESKGIQVSVVDCNIGRFALEDAKNHDIIAIGVMCSNVESALGLAERIKSEYPDKRVVLGGPHVRTDPEFFASKAYVDAVIVNEAEQTLYDYAAGDEDAKGIYKKVDGKVVYTGDREWIHDLDALPFPALDKVDLHKYRVPLSKRKPISSIVTSRGCPYGCTFCFHPGGKTWRPRSAVNVVDEIEWQVKMGVREICINDDNFTLDIGRAKDICGMIAERKLDVSLQFINGIRADTVDREFLEKFKAAGGWLVGVAPETGSAETMRRIKKDMDFDKVRQVVGWCKELGMVTHSYFMVGFPWETEPHLQDTLKFAKELDTEIVQFCKVVPFRSTELWEETETDRTVDREHGMFYGSLGHKTAVSDGVISGYVRKGHMGMLKPMKLAKLAREIPLANLVRIAKYSMLTGNL